MRSRTFTYRDAVGLLDGTQSPAFHRLDRMLGAVAGGVAIATLGAMDFFALRDELITWGSELVTDMNGRLTGTTRFDRTQRIAAAHAIILVNALFEGLVDEPNLEAITAVRLTREEQVAISVDKGATLSYADLLRALIEEPLPIPAPHRPFEVVLDDIGEFYGTVLNRLTDFLSGLSIGEHLRKSTVARLAHRKPVLVEAAIRRYVAAYRALAVDVPEFAMWAGMVDAQATRDAVTQLHRSVDAALTSLVAQTRGIDQILRSISPPTAAEGVRADLARRYRNFLIQPILMPGQQAVDAIIPLLQTGYVHPSGQVAVASLIASPSTDTWWQGAAVTPDVPCFAISHLTSADAVNGPLVILGQPGSGKSVLTRILAAELSDAGFLVVRVELRNIPADATILTQIENAILQTLDERISWPALVRNAGAALPVVIFDGFDELLQATGVNRADYLEQIQEFQRKEAELDRPVATIVTSRVVVADRARFPERTVVLRLEPFSDAQVGDWLARWNRCNAANLERQNLKTLPADIVLRHGDLCRQPLLLMLLALYDATANELQRSTGAIGHVELYDRLFTSFIEREVDKDRSLDREARREAVDEEWRRLSAVAIAALNRGSETISEAELTLDLPLLLEVVPATAKAAGLNRPLTVGELLVGRFFFIHESAASRDTGAPERTFEFLHATFGDFMAARQIVGTLVDLAEERTHQRSRRAKIDAGFLYALTSFATITRRDPLRDFCRGLLGRLPDQQRQSCANVVVELFADAGYPAPTWSMGTYSPRRVTAAARYANYSANLMCLAVFLAETPLHVVHLVGEPAAEKWRQMAGLWQSQLEPEDRDRLWQNFRVAWMLDTDPTVLTVRCEDDSNVSADQSFPWPEEQPAPDPSAPLFNVAADTSFGPQTNTGRVLRQSAFMQTGYQSQRLLRMVMPLLQISDNADGFSSLYLAGELLHARSMSEGTIVLHLLLSDQEAAFSRDNLRLYATIFSGPQTALSSRAANYFVYGCPPESPWPGLIGTCLRRVIDHLPLARLDGFAALPEVFRRWIHLVVSQPEADGVDQRRTLLRLTDVMHHRADIDRLYRPDIAEVMIQVIEQAMLLATNVAVTAQLSFDLTEFRSRPATRSAASGSN